MDVAAAPAAPTPRSSHTLSGPIQLDSPTNCDIQVDTLTNTSSTHAPSPPLHQAVGDGAGSGGDVLPHGHGDAYAEEQLSNSTLNTASSHSAHTRSHARTPATKFDEESSRTSSSRESSSEMDTVSPLPPSPHAVSHSSASSSAFGFLTPSKSGALALSGRARVVLPDDSLQHGSSPPPPHSRGGVMSMSPPATCSRKFAASRAGARGREERQHPRRHSMPSSQNSGTIDNLLDPSQALSDDSHTAAAAVAGKSNRRRKTPFSRFSFASPRARARRTSRSHSLLSEPDSGAADGQLALSVTGQSPRVSLSSAGGLMSFVRSPSLSSKVGFFCVCFDYGSLFFSVEWKPKPITCIDAFGVQCRA